MRTSRTGTCKGFTLLELIVVIFIVSLIAAVVFPSLHVMGDSALKSEAKRIASVVGYLNDTAISTKESCSLAFDFREDSLAWKGPGFEKSENFKTLAGVDLQSKGEVKEGQLTLLFGPLGGQEAFSIRLREGNDEMKVEYNPLSGRTKITDEKK
ncbi:MAG TPA: prepilin-type N-terminal cleavage/methylation domain-containing protein [Dissulfurispiraceae bacterium]